MVGKPRHHKQTLRQFINSEPMGSWIAISRDSRVVAVGMTAKSARLRAALNRARNVTLLRVP